MAEEKEVIKIPEMIDIRSELIALLKNWNGSIDPGVESLADYIINSDFINNIKKEPDLGNKPCYNPQFFPDPNKFGSFAEGVEFSFRTNSVGEILETEILAYFTQPEMTCEIAKISWSTLSYIITSVYVDAEWRHKGLATELWNRANMSGINIKHPQYRVKELMEWAKTLPQY